MLTMRTLAIRVAVASVCFGIGHSIVWQNWRWEIQNWVVETGEALGMQVVRISGIYPMGGHGVFFGDTFGVKAGNFVFRHAGQWAAAGLGCAGALAGYWVCAVPLGRTRWVGSGGVTRCGTCGYELGGLKEPRCPECGTEI